MYTRSPERSTLLPLEELWEWRHQFSKSTLPFRPYHHGASKSVRQLGRASKRHKTIPPKIAMPYLREALSWVIEYSPVILRGIAENWDGVYFTDSLSAMGVNVTVHNFTII